MLMIKMLMMVIIDHKDDDHDNYDNDYDHEIDDRKYQL